jgi:hypothetical protein
VIKPIKRNKIADMGKIKVTPCWGVHFSVYHVSVCILSKPTLGVGKIVKSSEQKQHSATKTTPLKFLLFILKGFSTDHDFVLGEAPSFLKQ